MEHGKAGTYVLQKCRCDVCKEGNRVRAKERRRLQAYGRYQNAFVDAAPVRAHVKTLMKQGWGYKQIALHAGIQPNRVSQLVYGRTKSERNSYATPRSKKLTKMSRTNAEKLLALEFSIDISSPGTRISSVGACRRAEALVCAGYSFNWQAQQMGLPLANYLTSLSRETISKKTHDRIKDLFDTHVFTKRVATTRFEQAAVTRCLKLAQERGYVPAMAWDDIDTDKKPVTAKEFTDVDYVDWAKLEMLQDGKEVKLSRAETTAFRQLLIDQGKSYADIDRIFYGRVTNATNKWVLRNE